MRARARCSSSSLRACQLCDLRRPKSGLWIAQHGCKIVTEVLQAARAKAGHLTGSGTATDDQESGKMDLIAVRPFYRVAPDFIGWHRRRGHAQP